MGIAYMEQIRGYPYMTVKGLTDEFEQSTATVKRRIAGIQKEIQSGRYNRYAVLEGGGGQMVNTYVYIDYEKYWKALQGKNTRKYVPSFNPQEIAEICGYSQRVVMNV